MDVGILGIGNLKNCSLFQSWIIADSNKLSCVNIKPNKGQYIPEKEGRYSKPKVKTRNTSPHEFRHEI